VIGLEYAVGSGVLKMLGIGCLSALVIVAVLVIIFIVLIYLVGSVLVVLIKYLPATVTGIAVWYFTGSILFGILAFFVVLTVLLAWKRS